MEMDIAISQDAYEKYKQKNDVINNIRLRPESETFIDAILSADMSATPEGREILEIIKKID